MTDCVGILTHDGLVMASDLRRTGLDEAVKYALISLDSTIHSNVTVGPPIDVAGYRKDELRLTCCRRLKDRRSRASGDPHAVGAVTAPGNQELPGVQLDEGPEKS